MTQGIPFRSRVGSMYAHSTSSSGISSSPAVNYNLGNVLVGTIYGSCDHSVVSKQVISSLIECY